MSSPRILGAWQVHNGRFPKGSQAKNVTQTAIGGGSRWTTNNAFHGRRNITVSMRQEMPIRITRL